MMKFIQSIGMLALSALLAAALLGCGGPEPASTDSNPNAAISPSGADNAPTAEAAASGAKQADAAGADPADASGEPSTAPKSTTGAGGIQGVAAGTSAPVDVEGVLDPPDPAQMNETADPYFVLFKHLFEEDPGLNGDIRYIAVDLEKVLAKDCTYFLALMEDFCAKQGYELLEDGVEGLIQKGLVKDHAFPDGIVVSFADESLTETKLVTNGQKWRSGDGAIGAAYTLEKKKGEWTVTKIEAQWIS